MTVAPDDFAELDELAAPVRGPVRSNSSAARGACAGRSRRTSPVYLVHAHPRSRRAANQKERRRAGGSGAIGLCNRGCSGRQDPRWMRRRMAATNRRLVRRLTRCGQPTASLLPFRWQVRRGLSLLSAFLLFNISSAGYCPHTCLPRCSCAPPLSPGCGGRTKQTARNDHPPSGDRSAVGTREHRCRQRHMVRVGNVALIERLRTARSNTAASCCAKGRFELVSGLLEIRYTTGVNVVIEGPTMYSWTRPTAAS